MHFEMTHKDFKGSKPECFSELNAPDWLTGANCVRGSTMDNRWFWEGRVLTLSIGGVVETDFRRVRRVS